MAKPTSPEAPWPVSRVNSEVKQWIERLGHLWVEGQITQVNMKPTWAFSYITLRDPEDEASVDITCNTQLLASLPTPIKDGDRVVVYGKPAFYTKRGKFSLWVTDIRHVGVGELLARIEALRAALYKEGLCAPERKKPLPFLPRRVGLITGRGSAAERDVIAVATARWPEVSFATINTAVQGPKAVPEIVEALRRLDAEEDVDVIIIARGGGSVEDLLPFSEEALARAVSTTRTPVISAIGHEPDHPVLDDVADVRAATPTDAAKKAVPDVALERSRLAEARQRISSALVGRLAQENRHLADLRSRPVLANPYATLDRHAGRLEQTLAQLNHRMMSQLDAYERDVASLRARVSALGPAATLARGYAVVQAVPKEGGEPFVLTSHEDAPPATQLRIRVSDGSITAVSMKNSPSD